MQRADCSEYFRRRAAQERTAAEQASNARAALTHREMAGRYEELATSGAPLHETESMPMQFGILPRDFQIVP